MKDTKTITASPSKELFIEMLTRDITLVEAILDLIDNSIHNVIRLTQLDVMRAALGRHQTGKLRSKTIFIKFSDKSFEIRDTCGGISIKDARDEVFRFGKTKVERTRKGLGVYGIGMKRAFFKIGNLIEFESKTKDEEFVVDIDVKKWRAEPDNWTFAFRYSRERLRSQKDAGTDIKITQLHPQVRRHFQLPSFLDDLRKKIATTYALFLREGIKVVVNGIAVKADLPEFARSADLGLTKRRIKRDDVDILIMIGLSPTTDKTPRGWYVFCNGRMVLQGDKTATTGWANGAQWNPKYNHFLGWVFFTSKNVSALPWRTTKEGVDVESPVFQHARGQMRSLAKPILAHLARSYPGDVTPSMPEREVLQKARRVSIVEVAKLKDTTFSVNVPQRSRAESVSIQYDRPVHKVKRIAESLEKKRLSARKVGEYTFDYYLKNCCD